MVIFFKKFNKEMMGQIYEQQRKMRDEVFEKTQKNSNIGNKSDQKHKLERQVTLLQQQLQKLCSLNLQDQVKIEEKIKELNKTRQKQFVDENLTTKTLKQKRNKQLTFNNKNSNAFNERQRNSKREQSISFRVGRIVKSNSNKEQKNHLNRQQTQTIEVKQRGKRTNLLLINKSEDLINSQLPFTPLIFQLHNTLLIDSSKNLQQFAGRQIKNIKKPILQSSINSSQLMGKMVSSRKQQSFFYQPDIQKNNNNFKQDEKQINNKINLQTYSHQNINNSLSLLSEQSFKNNQNTQSNSRFRSRLFSQNLNLINFNQSNFHGRILKNVSTKSTFQNSLVASTQKSVPLQNQQILKQQIPNNTFTLSELPYFIEKPHPKSNKQQIIQLTIRIAKKLSFTQQLKLQNLQSIVIKKYKNCLIFKIPSTNNKIIWFYQGKFYFGQGQKQGDQGFKQGQAIQYIPEKSFYRGQYFSNKKHGSGAIITIQGNIYEGQWIQDRYHGIGKFFDKQSKQIYKGQFKYGKFNGFGLLKISENQIYKGSFMRNVRHGNGLQLFKSGDKYQGQYFNGKFNGSGRYIWFNGGIYEGQFQMGMRTGFGKWFSSLERNGDSYVGMYLNDKKQGFGRYRWVDGCEYEGQFKLDMKHGKGQIVYGYNRRVFGRWQNNRLVEIYESQSKDIKSQIRVELYDEYLRKQGINGSKEQQ